MNDPAKDGVSCDRDHLHTAECWVHYEECGEHHAHTWWCGGGELSPNCPNYKADLRSRLRWFAHNARKELLEVRVLAQKLEDAELLDTIDYLNVRLKKYTDR